MTTRIAERAAEQGAELAQLYRDFESENRIAPEKQRREPAHRRFAQTRALPSDLS
jgi:hypothetical protein